MTSWLSRFVAGRRFRVLVLVGAVLLGLGMVPIVSAHADLVEASPGNGDQVDSTPEEVVLRFTEGVQIADVSVTDTTGERIDRGTTRIDAENPRTVRVPIREAGNGTYTVRWQALSVDGHTTRGSFFFVVGDEFPTREQLLASLSDDDEDTGAETCPIEPLVRGLLFVSALSVVGVPLVLGVVIRPVLGRSGRLRHRTRGLLVGLAGLLLVAVVLLAGIRITAAGSGASFNHLSQFFGTPLGRVSLTQFLLASGILGVTLLPFADRLEASSRRWLGSIATGGILLLLSISWTSHSAATIDGPQGVVVDVAHLLGAAAWVGGLAALSLLVPPLLPQTDDLSRTSARLIRRFSTVALAGVGLAVATGSLLASWHVPAVTSLGSTLYGQVLTAKVFLVVLAVGLGAVNRFVIHPLLDGSEENARFTAVPGGLLARLPERRTTLRWFVWSVRVELAILLVVLGLTGVMTSVPTAANEAHQGHGGHGEAVPLTLFGDAGDTEIRVRIIPVRVGLNVFDVSFVRDGRAIDADEDVDLLLRHPENDVELPQSTLEPGDEGRYSAVASFPTRGRWELRVSTWLDGQFVAERFTVTVPPERAAVNGGDDELVGQTETPTGQFPRLLRTGAGVVAGLSILAVSADVLALRRRES